MALGIANRQRGFWFGTEEKAGWFPTPNRGADMTSAGWEDSGTLLTGGGYNFSSFGSHKTYTFEWPASSSQEVAMLMQSYANGTYGRGLLYFVDCLSFGANVLPARYADPSIAVGYEGSTLVYGVQPVGIPQGSGDRNFPIMAARYNLNFSRKGYRRGAGDVFIPIPDGYTLVIGAAYEASGSGGVYVSPLSAPGATGDAVKLTALSQGSADLVVDEFTGVAGVYVWVGKLDEGAASVTLQGMVAKLIKNEELPVKLPLAKQEDWSPGMGHSGCRFAGRPTLAATGPANGGQYQFAASFQEVGSWVTG